MPGRILIADDRFASRLMLTALFGGAYYDILQVDHGSRVLQVARSERPGAVIISDRIAGDGAVALCSRLRADPVAGEALRIVITDRADPARAALLIDAGADDVMSRSCRDEEVLARLHSLLDYKSRVAELALREAGPRAQGLAEPVVPFARRTRVDIVSNRGEAQDWATQLGRMLPGRLSARVFTCEGIADGTGTGGGEEPDVVILDADGLGIDGTLRATAKLSRRAGGRAPQIIVARGMAAPGLGARALQLGASGLLALPFDPPEATARVALHIDRKLEIDRLHARLRNGLTSAMTDPLTGLFNRRYALPRIDTFMRQARESGRPAALIMADLDRFKWVNDTHGHLAGDAVLTAVAEEFRRQTPGTGFASRIGGEEFLIAVPDCNRTAASVLAEDIRHAVAEAVIPATTVPAGLRVTLSLGVAVCDPTRMPARASLSEDTALVMARADRALYRAKASGRNRVVSDPGLVSVAPPPARRQAL
ncbi:diguanylate cyclase response regulator [Primorskyibacter flagellatus]|uniref:diguanylate cyclase n=1 Tax=Primorskyibacter flagellatus TaxID=1387277 RepID=A0A917A604_9RHOB|nr:diguanylate cyclase [Primorskyibacter flagellatus]GGE29621.1 diguanylate cyclase response regulator [Primorskyibacter flagellatus]